MQCVVGGGGEDKEMRDISQREREGMGERGRRGSEESEESLEKQDIIRGGEER